MSLAHRHPALLPATTWKARVHHRRCDDAPQPVIVTVACFGNGSQSCDRDARAMLRNGRARRRVDWRQASLDYAVNIFLADWLRAGESQSNMCVWNATLLWWECARLKRRENRKNRFLSISINLLEHTWNSMTRKAYVALTPNTEPSRRSCMN